MNTAAATGNVTLDRTVELHLRGDWGQANMHRICGWIAQEVGDRSPDGSRFAIWSGRGAADQTDAILAGEADIAVLTPSALLRMIYDGHALVGGIAQPSLRTLGVVGQRDGLVLVADASLGIESAQDLLRVADRLVIATAADDGNAVGLAAHHGLRLAGADPEALEKAGAQFRYWERPFPAIDEFASGRANVLIQEAIMMPAWQRIARARPVRYLDWGTEVFAGFESFGWPTMTVPAGYLPGLERDLRTLDFSDFPIVCRADLPDDIAYLATWCMIQTRQALEVQYQHMPSDRTPVTYPLVPSDMAVTPIPLHPAAERAYRDLADAPAIEEALIWD